MCCTASSLDGIEDAKAVRRIRSGSDNPPKPRPLPGVLLSRKRPTVLDDQRARDTLIKLLADLGHTLQLEPLGGYGIAAADFSHIVANARGSSMKTNPSVLTDAEIGEILARRV